MNSEASLNNHADQVESLKDEFISSFSIINTINEFIDISLTLQFMILLKEQGNDML